jgi:tetratricopeptide (TPR) repeat protein
LTNISTLAFVLSVNIHENGVMTLTKIIGTLFLSVMAVSCSTQTTISALTTIDRSVVNHDISADQPKQSLKEIPIDALYDLLVGDIALNRSQFNLALEKYTHQADATGDIEVIKLAYGIAQYLRDDAVLLKMAQKWVEVSPQDLAGHQAALEAYVVNNNVFGALDHGSWIYQRYDDIDALIFIGSVKVLDSKQMQRLHVKIDNLALTGDKESGKALLAAIFYEQSKQLLKSEVKIREYLALKPSDQRGILLLSQLLHQQKKYNAAIRLLEDALENHPSDRKLRLQYARFLATVSASLAIAQLELLRSSDPADQEVNFLLALLNLSQGQLATAKEFFLEAATARNLSANAHYHLGTIEEQQNNINQAIVHYSSVRFGKNYTIAASKLSRLLAKHRSVKEARQYLQQRRILQPNKAVSLFQVESNLLLSIAQPSEALMILSSGLEKFPANPDLLYERSLVASQQDDFVLAENDLRTLLSQDNKNAAVLNALGYTISVHSDRQEEAYELIMKAYKINPNSPAIIDSLGWVLFKLGQPEAALGHLQKAYKIMADPEIAAHLGEVNWVMGNVKSAMQVWSEALEQRPKHKTIISTMERLGAFEDVK